MENRDLISMIADILHEKPSRIEAKVDALDINDMIKLVDAVANEDTDLIKNTLTMGMSEKTDVEDELEDADDININLDDNDNDNDEEDNHIHERVFDVNIGDEVSVNGEDGIVKVANGPNNTVGVLIDGEITMVHRGEIKPLKEHVLGMTNMPDLKRMQQLAGIMIDNITPADTHTMSMPAEPQRSIEVIDVPSDGCDENCDPKTAIDDAIEKIEQLLPQLRVGDYKDVTQRLQKAMNVIYESLNVLFKPSRLKESSGERVATRLLLRRVMAILESTSKAASKCSVSKTSSFARSLAKLSEKVEKLSLDAKKDNEKTKGRKSIKDYLVELDVNAQEDETIGVNRTDAIKTLQTRMGKQTTTQDAAKAYDKMRTTGKIKQGPTGMTMPAMGDDSLKNEVSAALGGGTSNSAIKK